MFFKKNKKVQPEVKAETPVINREDEIIAAMAECEEDILAMHLIFQYLKSYEHLKDCKRLLGQVLTDKLKQEYAAWSFLKLFYDYAKMRKLKTEVEARVAALTKRKYVIYKTECLILNVNTTYSETKFYEKQKQEIIECETILRFLNKLETELSRDSETL